MSSSVPKTITAVSISKTGGTDVLDYNTDVPTPTPKDGEVLVQNDFIGVNYIDTYFRTGLYPVPSFPYTLGRDGAGTVVSLGPSNTAGLAVGDRVAYLAGAAYASHTVAPVLHTVKLPESISNRTGVAALLQGLTALTMIRESYHVEKGDWILVHAAAGGVGLWLCKLLKAIGARTIATASTPEKRDLAKAAGAEVTMQYAADLGDDAFIKAVKDLTGGEGVAAVFDGVGKVTFDVSLACVRRKGTMVSFGNASGAVEPFTISRLTASNLKLLRPTLFGYLATREEFETSTADLFDLLKGDDDVKVHKVYDLKDVKQAHEDLEGRKTTGKLLLKP